MFKRIPVLILIISLIISAGACSTPEDIKRKMLHYVNSEYGFSLTFPDNWSSYRVFDTREFIDKDLKVPVFYFCLPSRSVEWQPDNVEKPYAAVFSVYVFSSESWAVYTARYGDNPVKNRILGKSEKNVFVLKYPLDLPADLYQYMKEIEKVIGTFNVIKE